MLDDFKTELKKLGFARVEREEKRHQSMAAVSKDHFVGHGYEVEEIGPSTCPLQQPLTGLRNVPRHQQPGDRVDSRVGFSFFDAPDEGPPTPPERDRKMSTTKQALGRVGTRISHLPPLGTSKSLN